MKIIFAEWLEERISNDSIQQWAETVNITPQMVQAAKEGDNEELWTNLLLSTKRFLQGRKRMQLADAEEIASQTVLNILPKLDEIDPEKITSYALSAASRLASNWNRNAATERQALAGDDQIADINDPGVHAYDNAAEMPEEEVFRKERVARLRNLIREMPPRMRDAISYYYDLENGDGEGIDDVGGNAEINKGRIQQMVDLGFANNASDAKQLLFRGRNWLKEKLESGDAFEQLMARNDVLLEQCLIHSLNIAPFSL